MIRLSADTYEWALKHLINEGDTDLFPPPFEIDAIKFNWGAIIDELVRLDLTNYTWSGGRRFVVPKEKLAFRNATQLDTQDSLILAGIVKEYGPRIESARISTAEKKVFSYRFDPQPDGLFYGQSSNWHEFWETSLSKAKAPACEWVVIADITDYYNQIYHHVLENQLVDSGIPHPVVKVITKLLSKLTHSVTRGIPVGPHSVHLLAECALIPVDRSLLSHGLEFCRYVDDVHFFCRTQEEAQIALYAFADILDKQQRLTLQKQKTDILPASKFVERANAMLVDRPLNSDEHAILKVIKKHSSNNPYATVSLTSLSAEELAVVSEEKLAELFELYLKSEPRNYPRIGWLLRRLSQVGAPGAMEYLLQNISEFTPALGDVARYIMRSSCNYSGNLEDMGGLIVTALNLPVIKHSEYIQIVLINLFAKVPQLDHINKLTAMYQSSSSSVRREIIIAAGIAKQGHWVKERKDEFATADPWLRRALIFSSSSLPGDEGTHWLKQIKTGMSSIEKLVAQFAFRNTSLKAGTVPIS